MTALQPTSTAVRKARPADAHAAHNSLLLIFPVVDNPQIHSDHERAEQGADGPAEDGAHPRVRGGDSR